VSTIKASDDHLTLSSDGSNKDIKFQANGVEKASISSTGIDVTGTATMDGLTVDGASNLGTVSIYDSGTNATVAAASGHDLELRGRGGQAVNLFSNGTKTATFANNGDISFYEDTGGTRKFFWDASAESLGIGTSAPFSDLHLGSSNAEPSTSGNMANNGLTISNSLGGRAIQIGVDDTNSRSYIQASYVNNSNVATHLSFLNGANEAMRIDSSGSVTMPNQPRASLSHSGTVSQSGPVLTSSNFYDTTYCNIGNHFNASTGRFTCPVAGVYRLYLRYTSSGSGANVRLRKNASTVTEAYDQLSGASSVSSEIVVSCQANDFLDIQAHTMQAVGGTQHKQVTFELLG